MGIYIGEIGCSKMDWKQSYWYWILLAASVFMFIFFSEDRMNVPTWGTGLFILTWIMIAMGESWKAWSKSGMIINTTLGIGKGANDGFNPSGDLRMATRKDSRSFACIATGGFVFAGFSMNGNKNFLVCPPEHVQQVGGNMFIKTRLRRIRLYDLPNYIQENLKQLPRFNEGIISKRHNLWFGMTSEYYGTDTNDNMERETKWLSEMSVKNNYKHVVDELTTLKNIKEPPEPTIKWLKSEDEE